MIEEKRIGSSMNSGIIQNLVLENREKLSISGVNDVLSFDDELVMIETELGLLTVKGTNLRINKLSIDTSEVIVEGEIVYLSYNNSKKEESSFLGKIFK
ncbi:Spore protein YabP [compost metagenome]